MAFIDCSNLQTIYIGEKVRYIGDNAFGNCKELESIYCYAKTVPTTSSNAFDDSYISYSTLYVPEESLNAYKAASPWKDFGTIKAIGDTEDPEKCAAPTIAFEDGKLKYTTTTTGAEIVSEVKSVDIKKSYDSEVELTGTYNITAYVTKSGMEDSDVTTATLVWLTAKLEQHVPTSAKAIAVPSIPVLISSNGGILTVTGMEEGTEVSAFSADGKKIDSAYSTSNTVTLNASSLQGNIAVVKVRDKSVKVMVK